MEFLQLSDFEDFSVKYIYRNYCKTFPENERRSIEQFQTLFENDKVKVFSILNESTFIGYLIIWQLEDFAFLEHFEVFEEFRNHKFGSEILNKLKENHTRIILETETVNYNEVAPRRIKFYQKNGFQEISNTYLQPSYGEGKTSLELLLFANFKPENLERITENIYEVVYSN